MQIKFLLVLWAVVAAYCEVVIDHAGKFSNYTCLKAGGYSKVIIRAYHSYGAIDLDAENNIRLANAAGLSTDVYLFPCAGKDPVGQANELITYLNGFKSSESYFALTTGTIWIDVETYPSPGCSWSSHTYAENCQFMKSLVNRLKYYGRSVGIYASHYMWLQIFGSVDSCNSFMDLPLWYAHYDNTQSFVDWNTNKFGGWTSPVLKQFSGSAKVCGLNADLSFY